MIRKYKTSDLESVYNLWLKTSTIAHPFLENDFVEKVKKDMCEIYIPKAKTWVYEENDELVGFISMLGNEVAGIFVNPNQQTKGIGTQLVDFVGQLHNELEVEVFEKNKIGRPFYEKYGFIFIKKYFDKASNQEILRLKFKKQDLIITNN